MNLLAKIESILFVASRPLSFGALAKALNKNEIEIEEAIGTLAAKFNNDASGIRVIVNGAEVQMGTSPENLEAIDGFMKDEVASELTRAQLESFTVIAYRGPITRPELEQIRGVNCALIIRNLLMRGLIIEEERTDSVLPVYRLSLEALRYLGVSSLDELPEYVTLHAHEYIENILNGKKTDEGDVESA